MIQLQRQYEMQVQVIKHGDENAAPTACCAWAVDGIPRRLMPALAHRLHTRIQGPHHAAGFTRQDIEDEPGIVDRENRTDAQQMRMSVVSNNLANTNTTGFKQDRAS